MNVRDAHTGDARRIAEIHVSAWRHAYAGLLRPETLNGLSVDERERRWQTRLLEGGRTVLVAENGNRVAGWLVFGPSRDDDAAADVAEIYAVYVDPDHWRSGAGRALWHESAGRLSASSVRRVTVWVLAGNERACRFYEWAGFTREPDRTKSFARDGVVVPEIRYARAL